MPDRNKTCPHCQKDYVDDSSRNSMRYCSVSCRRKAKVLRKAKKEGKDTPVFLDELQYECACCAKSFIPKDIQQMYCSVTCREEKYFEDRYKDVPPNLATDVTCLICSKEFKGCIPHGGRSGDHFKTHGMTTQEYLKKYPNASIYSEAAKWKMSRAERTFPEDFSEKCKNAQLRRYERDVIWNRGKTMDSELGLLKISEKARLRFENGAVNGFTGKKHSDAQKEMWSQARRKQRSDSVYADNWIESVQRAAKQGAYVSEPHAVVVQGMRDAGLWEGFEIEKWLTVGGITHGIDICGPFLAIEVDGCYFHDCPLHESHPDAHKQRLRDRQIDAAFLAEGWRVHRIWEHDVRDNLSGCVKAIGKLLGKAVEYSKEYSEVASNLDVDLRLMLAKSQAGGNLSEFDDQQVLEYYRGRGFPYPRHSSGEIQKDFDSLCHIDVMRAIDVEGDVMTQKRTGLGMKAPNRFSTHFWEARRKGKKTAIEIFNDDASFLSVIQSRRKHANRISDATIRTGLRLHASSPSSFPSLVAKYIYGTFLSSDSSVLDPCIGYGGRMVGSQSLPYKVDYVGYDPWVEAWENVNAMREWFGWDHCVLHNMPFEDATLDREFDLVFTSPPHFDKEVYSVVQDTQSIQRYPDYSDWIQGFIEPLVMKSYDHLKAGGHMVLHFSDREMSDDVLGVMQEMGLKTRILKWKQSSFLSGTRFEYFLIGEKPNA